MQVQGVNNIHMDLTQGLKIQIDPQLRFESFQWNYAMFEVRFGDVLLWIEEKKHEPQNATDVINT